MRVASVIQLTDEERAKLQSWASSSLTPVRLVERARIVLLAADGQRNDEIADQLSIVRQTVARWRTRFAVERVPGIEHERPGRGRKPTITSAERLEVVRRTQQEKPKGHTHWSRSTMARVAGISDSSVGRIWRAHGLKPHRLRSFKLSNDPHFVEKLTDVVGLYLSPPEHAIVFSVDEKSQIQALDRTQPGLPIKRGRAGTMTHDYKRNGTTTLFAALNVLTGQVIGTCMPKHTHREWLSFLRRLDRETQSDLDVHVICDNYATHKHPAVKRWLERHRRFKIHFTPTSASWLNMIERFFRDLTENAVRRGVFRSVPDLIATIDAYLATHNDHPKPFIWTKSAADILAKVQRARAALPTSTVSRA
jgi:transposase